MKAHFERVQLLLNQERYALALQTLQEMLAQEADDALVHALMALCLSEMEQTQQGLQHAQTAIGLSPDTAYYHYILGILQQENRQNKAAKKSLQQALLLDPEEPDYLTRMGLLSVLESRWSEALYYAEQALAQDPEHIDATNLRSMALIRLGQAEAAVANLDHALGHAPENARVHANRGWTLLQAHQYEQAMSAFAEALRLDPQLDWAREGMLEALKARHWVYRQFLRYSFWMSQHGQKHQLLIMIGLIVLIRLVATLTSQFSSLLTALLMVSYFGFVLLTWLADPLFNLLLRFHPEGRYLLSDLEVTGTRWTARLLIGASLAAVSGLLLVSLPLLLAAGLSLLMLVPTAGTFAAPTAHGRRLLGAYTLCLTLMAALSVSLLGFGLSPAAASSLIVFFLFWLGFSWFANWIMMRA